MENLPHMAGPKKKHNSDATGLNDRRMGGSLPRYLLMGGHNHSDRLNEIMSKSHHLRKKKAIQNQTMHKMAQEDPDYLGEETPQQKLYNFYGEK